MMVIWEVKVVRWEEMNEVWIWWLSKDFGFLEASLMRSRLDAANYVVINLFADEQAAQ